MKPVDLDALKNRIHGPERPEINDGIQEVFWVEKCMNEAPAISPDDLKPTGTWLASEYLYTTGQTVCSVCKAEYYIDDLLNVGEGAQERLPNYCPHCGSKMGDE